MSDLVMRAAELIGVIVSEQVREETSGLRAQLNAAQDERGEARRDYDELREQTRTLRDNALLAASIVRNREEWRDSARAELAGVAAQRDAYLSRSVELATRVTELETRLAALTPAPVEVDGFRVGDLVGFKQNPPPQQFGVVERVDEWVKARFPSHYVAAYKPHQLTRKPVEVGDTVRIANSDSPARYRVAALEPDDGGQLWARCHEGVLLRARVLIAVAP